jgi:hypothetical protein
VAGRFPTGRRAARPRLRSSATRPRVAPLLEPTRSSGKPGHQERQPVSDPVHNPHGAQTRSANADPGHSTEWALSPIAGDAVRLAVVVKGRTPVEAGVLVV